MSNEFFEINFLESSYRQVKQQEKTDLTYVQFAIGLFVATVAAWGGLKLYNNNLISQTAAIRDQEKQITTRLQTLSADQVPYLTYVAKTKTASSIIAQRHNAMELMKTADQYLTAQGATVSSFRYNQTEATVEITITMNNVQDMEKIILSLDETDFKDKFAFIEKQSLSRNMEGVYSTALIFELVK